MMHWLLRSVWLRSLPLLLCLGWAHAAVYIGRDLTYRQPDGTPVPLKLYGDEYYAWFETPEGYTLIRDPASGNWCYATRGDDGDLVSTGLRPDRQSGAALGLALHLRERSDVLRSKTSAARTARGYDRLLARWRGRQAAHRAAVAASAAGILAAPPASTTTGTVNGLVVTVDFSDDAGNATLLGSIDGFCNGNAFAAFGNAGSVKTFYAQASNGALTFTNQVSSVYLRLPHTKAYYNYANEATLTFRDSGTAGYLLVSDVLTLLNAMSDAERAAIGIDYSRLTADSSNGLRALSIFYAGDDSGVWSAGLWPHSMPELPYDYRIALTGNGLGKQVARYQITNVGSSLSIGTFVHECGHMVCDFPDLYNYDSDAQEGVGRYCLMDVGSYNGPGLNGTVPSRPCAYLRYTAGWLGSGRLVDLGALGTAAIGTQTTAGDVAFIYAKNPGSNAATGITADPTEYFLIENRNNTASGMIWDRYLPDGGLAIWHIDETSSNSTGDAAYTGHKECILLQADGRDDLGDAANYGDATDLFPEGANTAFDATTTPASPWWNGADSGLSLSAISAPGTAQTFRFGPGAPRIYTQPASPWWISLDGSGSNRVEAAGDPPPTYQWQRSRDGGATWTSIAGATTSVLSLSGVSAGDFGDLFRCLVANANGSATSDPAVLTEIPPPTPPTTTATTSGLPTPRSSAEIADDGRCGLGSGLGLALVGSGLGAVLLLRRRRSP